jgi:hypothetical protein
MASTRRVPRVEEFPPGTRFVIKDFDVPLACVPTRTGVAWVNWYGGAARPYDASRLRVGNNWPAGSFDEWAALVAASLPPPAA